MTIEDAEKICEAADCLLLHPRGARKYFIVQGGSARCRLAKQWATAQLYLYKGIEVIQKQAELSENEK